MWSVLCVHVYLFCIKLFYRILFFLFSSWAICADIVDKTADFVARNGTFNIHTLLCNHMSCDSMLPRLQGRVRVTICHVTPCCHGYRAGVWEPYQNERGWELKVQFPQLARSVQCLLSAQDQGDTGRCRTGEGSNQATWWGKGVLQLPYDGQKISRVIKFRCFHGTSDVSILYLKNKYPRTLEFKGARTKHDILSPRILNFSARTIAQQNMFFTTSGDHLILLVVLQILNFVWYSCLEGWCVCGAVF